MKRSRSWWKSKWLNSQITKYKLCRWVENPAKNRKFNLKNWKNLKIENFFESVIKILEAIMILKKDAALKVIIGYFLLIYDTTD